MRRAGKKINYTMSILPLFTPVEHQDPEKTVAAMSASTRVLRRLRRSLFGNGLPNRLRMYRPDACSHTGSGAVYRKRKCRTAWRSGMAGRRHVREN